MATNVGFHWKKEGKKERERVLENFVSRVSDFKSYETCLLLKVLTVIINACIQKNMY